MPERTATHTNRAIIGLIAISVAALTLGGFYYRHSSRGPTPRRVATGVPQPIKPVLQKYPDPLGIVLHDSDTPASIKGVAINAARLEAIHAHDHPSWATRFEGKTYHIGYHYVVLPSGVVEHGRPDHCPGCHARKFNDWIGICVIGAFSVHAPRHWWPSVPTPQQMTAVVRLCETLMSEYHIPPRRVKRHEDVNVTWCPGNRFPYTDIMTRLKAYASDHPETSPAPPIASAPKPKASRA